MSEMDDRRPSPIVDFDHGFWIETTAGRVALLTCTRCGASVTNDPGSYRHKDWHTAEDGTA